MAELQVFGSFWAVAVFGFAVSALLLGVCEFVVTGSSPVAPIGRLFVSFRTALQILTYSHFYIDLYGLKNFIYVHQIQNNIVKPNFEVIFSKFSCRQDCFILLFGGSSESDTFFP